jgi:hypothetical protein
MEFKPSLAPDGISVCFLEEILLALITLAEIDRK